MKQKIIFLFILLLSLVSCNQGSINGYVTYQLSEFGSSSVDQYAEIYITKKNIDTIKTFLTITHLEEQIQQYQKDMKRTNNKYILDSLQKKIIENKKLIREKASNKHDISLLADKAMRNLIKIKEDKRTYKELVDNEGMYSSTIKVGNYNLIAISEMIKKENLLERRGKLFIMPISISKDKQIKVNINFK